MVYGTQRFNATFTRALHEPLTLTESTQFLVLKPISLESILIMSSHLCLGLAKDAEDDERPGRPTTPTTYAKAEVRKELLRKIAESQSENQPDERWICDELFMTFAHTLLLVHDFFSQ